VERFFASLRMTRDFVGADAHISPRERGAAPLRIDYERTVVGAGFHARPQEAFLSPTGIVRTGLFQIELIFQHIICNQQMGCVVNQQDCDNSEENQV